MATFKGGQVKAEEEFERLIFGPSQLADLFDQGIIDSARGWFEDTNPHKARCERFTLFNLRL
jgi:hypothetical protein